MRHRIVILEAGTGDTFIANRLRRIYGDSAEISVIDRDERHNYQPAPSDETQQRRVARRYQALHRVRRRGTRRPGSPRP